MASQLIELFSGKVTKVDNIGHTIEVDLDSEFGYKLASDQKATFAIYVPDSHEFQLEQQVTQYLSTEVIESPVDDKEFELILINRLLLHLKRTKPNDRSDSDRHYAIAITEAEKLAAYIMTYLVGEE